MSKTYEFSYQSPRQKTILLGVKFLVAAMIGHNLYRLAWQAPAIELGDKLTDIAGVLLGFWIYSNLCKVKIEVQELFVEPMDIKHMQEAMWLAALLYSADMMLTVVNILRLHGIYL